MADGYQLPLPIRHELVVDLFAGGGGASTGLAWAYREPDVAINHDPVAIAVHRANHPATAHYCTDVFEVDPVQATGGQPVGVLWASPDCKHFSKAKGGKPVSKKIRSLAWVVVKWASAIKPRIIHLENVEEFQTWGPLGEDNRPCQVRKGLTFRRWKRQLENLGYVVEHRELRACDYGAPTIRKRLYLIARRDGQPIVWPKPTHAKPDSNGKVPKGMKPWRTAAEIIDWSIPCPSIFERSKPLADATCRRIAKGIMRYVVDAAEPFIIQYHSAKRDGDDRTASLGNPLPTQTTENRFALAVPTLAPVLTEIANASSPRCMPAGEPLRTVTAMTKGGHHALVTSFLAKHYTGAVGSDMDAPIGTVTSVDHHSLVTATIETADGSNSSFQRTDQGRPAGGSAGWNRLESGSAGQPAARDANHAQAGRAKEQKRVSDGEDGMAWKSLLGGRPSGRLRCVSRTDPSRHGPESSGRGQGQQQSLQPGAVDARGEPSARASDRPSGCIDSYYQGVDYSEEVRAFLMVYYGTDQDPNLREPLHTVTTKDRFGLVTVHGEEYAIVDIGLRMLTPRELARAQGFPDDYILDRGWFVDAKAPAGEWRPTTKTDQVRLIGNSVCPPVAAAIARANLADLVKTYRTEAA